MSYTYWKWDKAIPKEYCELIIKSIDWSKQEVAKIRNKKNIDYKRRKTDVVWESSFSVVGCIADKYIRAANIAAGWNYEITNTEGIQIGKYCDGGFYEWHADEPIVQETPRKLSFSLLLNDPKQFEGGHFELKGMKEQPILEQGSIIVFPSSLVHRVTPVTSGTRYSAVTWMHGPNFK